MFRLSFSAPLLAALLTAAAHAEPPKEAPKGSSDEVVCTFERTVGSHLKKRVCATRGAREERARADRDALDSYKRPGAAQPPAGTER